MCSDFWRWTGCAPRIGPKRIKVIIPARLDTPWTPCRKIHRLLAEDKEQPDSGPDTRLAGRM